MRNMASVKKIKKIYPIENADLIERAVIDGYDVVVKKGEFAPGDFCVYCEVDSILPPENPDFAFLEGKRIKIKRLRGIYSYGIAFPMSILKNPEKYSEGDDLTEILGVRKWEPDPRNVVTRNKKEPKAWWYRFLMRFSIGRWFYNKFLLPPPTAGEYPSWIPKTDETRMQSVTDVIEEYVGTPCMITEKLDGSSTTHWLDKDGKYHNATRNRELFDKTDWYYKAALENNIPELLKNLPEGSVVQGELIGPKIQGNKYGLDHYEIWMFNLRVDNKYLDADETIRMLQEAGFKTVPVIDENYILESDREKLLELSIDKSRLNKKQQREGIVIRPIKNIQVQDEKGRFVDGRLSFKIINPKFELQQ